MVSSNIADIESLRRMVRGRVDAGAKPSATGVEMTIDAMRSQMFADEVRRCVPRDVAFDVDRLLRISQTMVRSDAKLAAAEPRSVLGAIMECASLALMPGYPHHVYLSTRPVQDEKGFSYEAQLVPGWRGLVALAKRGGDVSHISSRIVTDKEIAQNRFDLYYEGTHDTLTHKPILVGEKGAPVLVYCLVRFKDGTFHVEPMSADDIAEIRTAALQRSAVASESAWVTHEMDMWRYASIRRAIKYLNISVDGLPAALRLDDRAYQGVSQGLAERLGSLQGAPAAAVTLPAAEAPPGGADSDGAGAGDAAPAAGSDQPLAGAALASG